MASYKIRKQCTKPGGEVAGREDGLGYHPCRANAQTNLADIKPVDFLGLAAHRNPDGKPHAGEIYPPPTPRP
jgi:hypothetical protein